MSETYNGCDTSEYIAVPGPQGPQGQRGAQGNPGPMGPPGPEGPAGVMGPQGCQGPKGDRGPRGEKGDKGEPGTPGERGPEGPEGPRGCNGASGKVSFDQLNAEQIAMLKGKKGDKGERGPIGPQGPRGEQGHEGPQGDRGEKGDPGANGVQGAQGSPGERGPVGPQGLTGPKGEKGDPGDARISDQVERGAAWGGKHVIDYALNGNAHWENKQVTWGHEDTYKVTGTANGYAKNVCVHGNTEINYSTLLKVDATKEYQSTLFTDFKNEEINVFDYMQEKAHTPLTGFAEGYTVIYKIDGLIIEDPLKYPTNFDAKITVVTVSGNGDDERFETPITTTIGGNGNYIKLFVPKYEELISSREGRKIRKIILNPIALASGQLEEGYNGVKIKMTLKGIMLLKGNWTHSIPPEYFHDTKGVGIKEKDTQDSKYLIKIETRNKNLFNDQNDTPDYYLKANNQHGDQEKLIYSQSATQGTKATYLIYCKPNKTYTFSLKVKSVDHNIKRVMIAGFIDDPHNGEQGEKYAMVEGASVKGTYKVTFTTGNHINMLVLYLGNFEQKSTGGENRTNWNLLELYENVQLEEGPVQTVYEPFRYSQRTIKIDKPLFKDDKLYWNEIKGQYFTRRYQPTSSTYVETETGIVNEELIHTFNDVTYTFIRSKIPSSLEAYYPIKAHADYYTRKEIDGEISQGLKDYAVEQVQTGIEAFKNENSFTDRENTEELNGLKLFNGFGMFWKTIEIPLGVYEKRVTFAGLPNIIHAQATRAILNSDNESGIASTVTLKKATSVGNISFDVIDKAVVDGENEQLKQKKRTYYIMAITDFRTQ